MRMLGSDIYMFGGFDGTNASNQLWKYDIGMVHCVQETDCERESVCVCVSSILIDGCDESVTNVWTLLSRAKDAPPARTASAMVWHRSGHYFDYECC
jgi:hypothetical protein